MHQGIGELAVPVVDEEVERRGLIAQVHLEIAGGLGGPRPHWVGGHPENVHPRKLHGNHDA